MIYRLLPVGLFLLYYSQVKSQSFDEKNFVHYTAYEGLSNNFISGIEQDSKGYIWIGTHHGLNRFDGSHFKQFLKHETPNALVDNFIFSMKMLPNQQLAIATEAGAQLISTTTLKKTKLDIPTSEALRYWSNSCKYILNDKNGNIGVTTKTGFYIFSPSAKLIKEYKSYTDEHIGRAWMNFGKYMYQLPDGNLMAQSENGLLFYNAQKKQFDSTSNTNSLITSLKKDLDKIRFYFISSHLVLILNKNNCFELADLRTGERKCFPSSYNLVDKIGWRTNLSKLNDSVWAFNSNSKGFYLITIDTVNRTIRHSDKIYFGDYLCTTVFSDVNNRLWVGTDKGLFMQKTSTGFIRSFSVTLHDQSPKFIIRSLLVTQDKVFAGIDNGEMLLINKQSMKVENRIKLKVAGNNSSTPLSLLQIHPDTIWMTSHSGLIWMHTKNLKYGKIFPDDNTDAFKFSSYLMFLDSRKNIWIGTSSINKIFMYDRKQSKLNELNGSLNPLFNTNLVDYAAEDVNGNIWLGGDAIVRWNHKTSRIDTLIEYLPTQQNRKKGYAVMNNAKGEIWAMINDDGIIKIAGNENGVHLRPANFLPDKSQFVFPALLNNKIFIATSVGIGLLDISEGKAIVFSEVDGFPPTSTVSTARFTLDSSDNSVWFAKQNIIYAIPERVDRAYMSSPSLSISELAILKGDILSYPVQNVSLKYFQNDIKISLSVINFSDPKNMRFAYRFKNKKDTSWIDIGTQQIILLTNISPGTYKLQAKVSAYDNKWTHSITEIEIVVNPPFWKTLWFLGGIILLIAVTVYYLYSYRIKQINQRANLDKLLAQTEMKALHTQMNPHFIFNCLNSIKKMILDNENANASRYLSKFAQLIRITLNQSSKPFISLHNTIDYLQRYLEMEQVRTNKFNYNIETDSELHLEDIYMPPMLIQPLIENAIWHGELPEHQIMQINIRFKKEGNKLVCIVEDNGIGIEASLKKKGDMLNHTSLGIANIRQRIQVLNEKYNMHCTLNIEDKSGASHEHGTIATLLLPIKNTES